MLVMSAIAIVCVVGIVGALASTLRYDQLYGQNASGVQFQARSVRRPRSRRRSRQLRAVEAALATNESEPSPACSPPSRRKRWSRR